MTNNTTGLLYYLQDLNLLGLNARVPFQSQLVFETVAGSHGRGVATMDSDLDVVGVYAPFYETLYPFKVPGFGRRTERFKASQVKELDVHLDGLGNVTVDVQANDLVHFFNMLIKPSPNHVELLFFSEEVMAYGTAGKYLLKHRDMFVTQALVTKFVATGCSILSRMNEETQKKYALAARFFSYAHQAVNNGTLDVDAPRNLNLRMLNGTVEQAKLTAECLKETAIESESKTTDLPPQADEEEVNSVLDAVLKLHWAEMAILESEYGTETVR